MQIYILVTLTLGAAFSTLAQSPQPCRSPPLFAGRLVVMLPKDKVLAFEKFNYDAFQERIRLRAVVKHQNQTTYVDDLLLFKEGVAYKIHHHNKTCTKQAMKASWKPAEIPREATFQRMVVIGSFSAPGQGLLTSNWAGEVPEESAQYYMSFTEFGCLPVYILYDTPKTGRITTSFYDLVLGVEDPDVFLPPSFCETAQMGNSAPVSFFEALLS